PPRSLRSLPPEGAQCPSGGRAGTGSPPRSLHSLSPEGAQRPWGSRAGTTMKHTLLQSINSPADVRRLTRSELKQLACELRDFVLHSVSQTGGHLSSNLGTVELTVALHHVYNTPHDRLVWDVGHQTYPHKILTGPR